MTAGNENTEHHKIDELRISVLIRALWPGLPCVTIWRQHIG